MHPEVPPGITKSPSEWWGLVPEGALTGSLYGLIYALLAIVLLFLTYYIYFTSDSVELSV